MLSSLSLCSPREWSLACLALSGPFATTGIYIRYSLEEGPPTWRTLGTYGMLCNFQRLSRLIFHEGLRNVSQFGCDLSTVWDQNGDCLSSRGIVSLHRETLGAIEAPKGKITQIWYPPRVRFGDRFVTVWHPNQANGRKMCFLNHIEAGLCKSRANSPQNSGPTP